MATLHLGTQGFSYQDWVGNFYPPHTRPENYLTQYAQHFRAVELDTTFYGVPRITAIETWYEETPPDFIFTAKFPRSITHAKKLINAEAETGLFLNAMQSLREKCGPLLLQFKYDFDPKSADDLDRYLTQLPKSFRYAIEFRHKGWLQDRYFDLLNKHRIAFCLHDLHYTPKIARLTTDFTYIRWLGNRKQLKHFERIQIDRTKEQEWWSGAAKEVLRRGINVYGFFNNYWAGHAPSSAEMFLKQIVSS
jgi:uncharacterized protein YecE (DUF72 family)